MNVFNKNADNRDTIAEVLSFLYDEFKVENEMEHLVAAGDAKTYSHLQAIKSEYGSTMDWRLACFKELATCFNKNILRCRFKTTSKC